MFGLQALLGRIRRFAPGVTGAPLRCRGGFSLIEVCLAILVIGFGLVAVFSLFPSGLRSSDADTADTRTGLFTETVLDGLRANASSLNLDDWNNSFATKVVKDVLKDSDPAHPDAIPDVITTALFPAPVGAPTDNDYLRYRLTINTTVSNRYYAVIEVENGHYPANSMSAPSVAYTEFVYTGE